MNDSTSSQGAEISRIVDQLERTFEGDAWHGPSVSEILADISAEQAAARPLGRAHSIWEILVHMTVWQRTVRERLQGTPLRPLPPEVDWPAIENVSDGAWSRALADLRREYELLRDEALKWSDVDLGELTEGQRYTAYQMLHGVIQHNLWHGGQIAILKKDEELRSLEHDLETATQVQANLLPERNFSFGRWQIHYHYQPLGAVSGDHIDLIRPDRNGKGLHFLFGDVAGKGVAASILMANLHALFRTLVRQGLPLGEIMGRANQIFCEATAGHSYATLVAGRLNGRGSLEVLNAGHNPPLIVRASGVAPIAAAGLPLGIDPGARFEAERFRLESNDYLFLYTDGLSEATDPRGCEYGASRIASGLAALRGKPAEVVVDTVIHGVSSFRDGAPRSDDQTAMAIRRRATRRDRCAAA